MKKKNPKIKTTGPYIYSQLENFWNKNSYKYANSDFVFKNSFNSLQLKFFFWMTTDWIFEDKLMEKLKIDREQLMFLLSDFDELQEFFYKRQRRLSIEPWVQKLPKGKKLYLRLTTGGFRIKEALFTNNKIPFSVIGYDEKLRNWVMKLYELNKEFNDEEYFEKFKQFDDEIDEKNDYKLPYLIINNKIKF